MLERWQFARSHLVNDTLDSRVREDTGFSENDPLGCPNVLYTPPEGSVLASQKGDARYDEPKRWQSGQDQS